MTPRLFIGLTVASLALGGCGQSNTLRWSPLNVLGLGDADAPVATAAAQPDTEIAPLIPEISALKLDRTPGGVILRATGLPTTQGWHGAELVAQVENALAGTLSFEFRARPPAEATRSSTPQSREITAAVFLSDFDLEGVNRLRVLAAQNSLAIAR